MVEATPKAYGIDSFLGQMMGKDRVETIADNKCMTCDNPNTVFRDELSKKEYTISGMCQDCQDKVFGNDQVHVTADNSSERKDGHFFTEASTLNLAVGDWPIWLTTDVGNGKGFQRIDTERNQEGEIILVKYQQEDSDITLTVFND